MKHISLVLLLVLALGNGHPAGDSVVKTVLSNGLTLIVKNETQSKVVAIEVFVRIGAEDEDKMTEGIGHILAASILGGSKSRSARQYARLFSEVGGSFQASWQWDYLEIYGLTLPELCNEAITLLADSIQQPAFRSDVVEYAKSAILSQMRTGENRAFDMACTDLRKALYPPGPYRRSLIGNPEVIKSIGHKDLEAFYKRCFKPNRIVISIVGKVNPEDVSRKVSRLFGNMDYSGGLQGRKQDPPPRSVYLEKTVGYVTYLMFGFPAADMNSPEYAPLCVANTLLGANKSSLLFRKIREELGIGYQVGSIYPALRGPSHIVAYVGIDANRTTPEMVGVVKNAVIEQVSALRDGRFTDEDLERAKRYLIGTHAIKHERVRDRAYYLGWYEVMGRGYQYDAKYADDVRSVTKEDVMEAAQRYLTLPAVAAEN